MQVREVWMSLPLCVVNELVFVVHCFCTQILVHRISEKFNHRKLLLHRNYFITSQKCTCIGNLQNCWPFPFACYLVYETLSFLWLVVSSQQDSFVVQVLIYVGLFCVTRGLIFHDGHPTSLRTEICKHTNLSSTPK